jgi:hypothetical protein
MIEKRKAGRPPSVDGETSFLHIRCRPSEKAMWVKSGQNKGGLSKWVKKTLNEAVQVRCESEIASILDDLRTEADLCRNETADDIANLLDSAANEIEHLRSDVGELAMLVKRLAQSLLKAAPEHDLPSKALDYLRRARLCGSPLREE